MPWRTKCFNPHQRNLLVVLMVIKQRLAADQGTSHKKNSLKWDMYIILHPPKEGRWGRNILRGKFNG